MFKLQFLIQALFFPAMSPGESEYALFISNAYFYLRLINSKSCNPGILQDSVTFYERCSCQIWCSLLTPVSRYWAKLRRGYFQISGQSRLKRNCHNSRTIEKENCDAVVIFLSYGQVEAILKPDSGRIVCGTYIFSNSNLLSYKNFKQN